VLHWDEKALPITIDAMSKEVTMTFRLEEDLRTHFAKAAELEHRPAAQVLRDLMRMYVEQIFSESPTASTFAPSPFSSTAEHRSRREAVEYALGSVGLEGFQLDKAAAADAQRFIDGEIDLDELVKLRGESTFQK
jgi:Antitoxin VbhA